MLNRFARWLAPACPRLSPARRYIAIAITEPIIHASALIPLHSPEAPTLVQRFVAETDRLLARTLGA